MERWSIVVAGLIAVLMLAARAHGQGPPRKGDVKHTEARLVAEHAAYDTGGDNWIGIHFKIMPKWHLYWDGVNDSGFAPKVKWHAPAGVTIGALQWPAPVRRIDEGDILDHVYENEVTLIAPVTIAPEALASGTIEIKASVEWLVCEEVCVPEDAELAITMPVRKTREAAQPTPDASLFGKARARIPAPWTPADTRISVDVQGEKAIIKARDGKGLKFYPSNGGSKLVHPIEDAATEGDTLTLALDSKGKPPALKGVVEVGAKDRGVSPILLSVQIPAK